MPTTSKPATKAPGGRGKVAPAAQKSVRGNMVQTSITMTPKELEQVNQAAEENHMSRAAFIRFSVFRQIEALAK